MLDIQKITFTILASSFMFGADLQKIFEQQDEDGNTQLHTMYQDAAQMSAACKENTDLAEHLAGAQEYPISTLQTAIAAHAHLNTQNKLGQTPLMLAVLHKNKDTIALLLQAQADISLKDKQGKDVFSYAQEDCEIIQLLKKNSPKVGQQSCKTKQGA